MVVGDLGDLLPKPAFTRPHDHAPHAHAVRVCDCRRLVEVAAQLRQIEVGVDRQFLLDEERRDEDDAGAAIRREAAREVEGVLRFGETEERDDDVAVAKRDRSPRESPNVGTPEPHRRRWYGTLVRMTLGSKSSSRLR